MRQQQPDTVNHIKEFADFILRNHLEALSYEVLLRLKQSHSTGSKLFENVQKDAFIEFQKKEWIEFLTGIIRGDFPDNLGQKITHWKSIIKSEYFSPTDFSLVVEAQKYCLIRFLPRYTQDMGIYHNLILQLEDLYSKVNHLLFIISSEYQKEKLTYEKEFLEALINNSTDEIFAFDRELRFTAWNKKLEDEVGIHKEEVIGKSVFDIFPSYRHAEGLRFREALQGKAIHFQPVYYPSRKRYVQMNVIPLNYNQEIIGGVTMIKDVTSFKEIENQLREREKFISNITSSVPLLIYVFDLIEQKNIYINRSAIDFLGYTDEQVLDFGDRILDAVMHPDERELLDEHYQKVANSEEGTIHEYEYQMRKSDGTWRWFLCRDILLKRTSNGIAWQVLGIAEDITEKKEAGLKILKSQKISDEIQALAHIGYYEWNAEITKVYWSDEMYRIYGYEPGEIELNQEVMDTMLPPEARAYRHELMGQLFLEPGSYDYEHQILKKDGKIGVVTGKVRSYTDPNGNVLGVRGYAQDITDKYLAQQKLKENEHFNKTLTQSSPLLIFVFDLINYSLVFGNKSTEEFLGYTNDKISSLNRKAIRALIHPEDRSRVARHLEKVSESKNGEVLVIEYRLKDHKGTYRWLRSHETVIKRDKKGKAILAIGNSQDITSLKETGQALMELNTHLEQRIQERTFELEQSRKQINLIIDSIPALISYIDKDQRYFFVNKAYTLWNLKEADFFVEKTVREIYSNEVYSSILPYIQEVLRGKEVSFETTIPYPSGTKKVQVTYVPDKDEQEQVKGFVALVVDLTRQKNLEEELRQRERELRLITDAVPASISYISEDERYLFANKTAMNWSGKKNNIIGMHIVENIGPDYYNQVKPDIKKCLSGHHVSFDAHYNQNNIERDVRIQYIPDISETGKVRGFISLVIDISEDKRKETDLKNKNDELIKINNDLDNFIYTASHDLKAPVSNIEGLVNSLSEQFNEKFKLDEENQFIIQLIKDSILRFQQTINDLTEITKTQKNLQEDIEVINIAEIINEIEWSLDAQINESNTRIETNLAKHSSVKFSRVNMRSILHNLISNAIKYRSETRQPVIRILTKNIDKNFIIEVSDNGLGLKEDQKEKIFQMFKRLHNHVEGTGIGLYIVKRIVENGKGTIEVESQEGEGSLFRIRIPSTF